MLWLGAVLAAMFLSILAALIFDRFYSGPKGLQNGMSGRVRVSGGADAPPVSAESAERLARWMDVAFADAQTGLKQALAGELVGPFNWAKVRHFTDSTQSPCAESQGIGGPFYCPRTRTAAFDARFVDAVGSALRADRDPGTALLAGQIAAVHAQSELGMLTGIAARAETAAGELPADLDADLALHADCLTGVWAGRARRDMPTVTPDMYGRVVELERSAMENLDISAGDLIVGYDLFGNGDIADRTAAFAAGFEAADVTACANFAVDLRPR